MPGRRRRTQFQPRGVEEEVFQQLAEEVEEEGEQIVEEDVVMEKLVEQAVEVDKAEIRPDTSNYAIREENLIKQIHETLEMLDQALEKSTSAEEVKKLEEQLQTLKKRLAIVQELKALRPVKSRCLCKRSKRGPNRATKSQAICQCLDLERMGLRIHLNSLSNLNESVRLIRFK